MSNFIRYLNLGELLEPSSTSVSVIHPQHEVVQRYGAILLDYLTNLAIKESKATKSDEAPKPSSGKRVKATAKVAKSRKKNQPAPGLKALSDIALTKAEQMKMSIERSKTQLHISQPSGSGAHEGTGVTLGVPDVPIYGSDDEQLSWKSSDEEDDDDDEENVVKDEDDDDHNNDDEWTESDNDGEDFVHPYFSTHDDEARQEEVNKDDSFDLRMDEEATNAEGKTNVLYRDMNINMEGRDIVMKDALLPSVQATQETEDTHVILTALINPEGQ
ncbi:hypothetical protein Tco_0761013 [Tanacetum coccineum]